MSVKFAWQYPVGPKLAGKRGTHTCLTLGMVV